jgi:hypothetical protein
MRTVTLILFSGFVTGGANNLLRMLFTVEFDAPQTRAHSLRVSTFVFVELAGVIAAAVFS